MSDYVYDVESLPKCFTLTAKAVHSGKVHSFEVSPRKNDFPKLIKFLLFLKSRNYRMVGFNNVGYDYPVLHLLMRLPESSKARVVVGNAWKQTKKIIGTPFDKRFSNQIKPQDRHIEQVDLMMINHFDNVAKSTSLKMLEFVMRMQNIHEFDMKAFTTDQIDELLDYNDDDVEATYQFYKKCLPQIEFRKTLSESYGYDMTNFNDTKIGEWVLVKALEDRIAEDICYYYEDGKRKMRQSHRDKIVFEEIIFDYITFKRPEFRAIHEWMNNQIIKETKGVFNDITVNELGDLKEYVRGVKKSRKYNCEIIKSLHCYADDFEFVFGVGGIHGTCGTGYWSIE